jgi:hypothetical protein
MPGIRGNIALAIFGNTAPATGGVQNEIGSGKLFWFKIAPANPQQLGNHQAENIGLSIA